MRRLLSLAGLALVLFWLLASYLPQIRFWSPITYQPELFPWFRLLLMISVVLFVVIQTVLLGAVARFPSRVPRFEPPDESDPTAETIQNRDVIYIDRRLEYIWTAMPLLGTVVLIGMTYHLIGG